MVIIEKQYWNFRYISSWSTTNLNLNKLDFLERFSPCDLLICLRTKKFGDVNNIYVLLMKLLLQ